MYRLFPLYRALGAIIIGFSSMALHEAGYNKLYLRGDAYGCKESGKKSNTHQESNGSEETHDQSKYHGRGCG
jgi:hypothetical protein